MTNKTIARRYAKALFSIGEEQGKVAVFAENLREVLAVLEKDEEVNAMIDSHFISITEKKNLAKQIFASFDPLVINFISLILDKGRGLYLQDICKSYQDMLDESENILHAIVKSAVPLNAEQLKKIEDKFSSLTSQTVKAQLSVDQSLIGGIQVRVGDKVYDGTIALQLKRMGEDLKETKMLG